MPGAVAIEGLSLSLAKFRLEHIDLAVEPGQILVLLGPNGAGKSVTLEAIAGFHRLEAGRIRFGERDVTALAPEHRNVGLLFQDFSLFPHMTVAANIALGLRARRPAAAVPDSGMPRRDLDGLLGYFGIAGLAQRLPGGLSPGERQRAALARGMAAAPELFMFDEPFSALDMRSRELLRADLGRFLHASRIPAIFVTHDQADAFALADRIAVMREGRIVQAGAPATIFRTPVNRFVAEFVGVENILAGRFAGTAGDLRVFSVAGQILHGSAGAEPVTGQRDMLLCIRAEDVAVEPLAGRAAPGANLLRGQVVAIATLGALCRLTLDCGFPLHAYVMSREARERGISRGSQLRVEIKAEAIHAIAPAAGQSLRAAS
jgi:ABC-type Fe3+/spermidine/putrescine transport system ATPase subunit